MAPKFSSYITNHKDLRVTFFNTRGNVSKGQLDSFFNEYNYFPPFLDAEVTELTSLIDEES